VVKLGADLETPERLIGLTQMLEASTIDQQGCIKLYKPTSESLRFSQQGSRIIIVQ